MNLVIVSVSTDDLDPKEEQAARNSYLELVSKLSRNEAPPSMPQYFLLSTHELLRALSVVRPLHPEVSLQIFSLKTPSEQLVEGVTDENAADPASYLLTNRTPIR